MVEKYLPSWLQIIDNKEDKVLREFKLCQRNEDEKFGYYEYVNDKFFPMPDDDKERYYTYIKGQKIKLYDDTVQYLDNSIQYIDTGFNPRRVKSIYIGQPYGEPCKKYVVIEKWYGMDKKPENSGRYLVWKDGNYDVAFYSDISNKWCVEHGDSNKITHWTNMPAPPERSKY